MCHGAKWSVFGIRGEWVVFVIWRFYPQPQVWHTGTYLVKATRVSLHMKLVLLHTGIIWALNCCPWPCWP